MDRHSEAERKDGARSIATIICVIAAALLWSAGQASAQSGAHVGLDVTTCTSGEDCLSCDPGNIPGLRVVDSDGQSKARVTVHCDRPGNRRNRCTENDGKVSKLRWTMDVSESAGETLLVTGKTPVPPPAGFSPLAYRPAAGDRGNSSTIDVETRAANYRYLRFNSDSEAVWPYALYLLDDESNIIACGDPVIIIRDG